MTAHSQKRGDVAVLVPAAGRGERLGPGGPKALRSLAGDPLLAHALRRLVTADSVGFVVIAAPPGQEDLVTEVAVGAGIPAGVQLRVVAGGTSRRESVRLALAATPVDYDIVLVHDAARALAPAELFDRVAEAVRAGQPAVIPVRPVVDTIKQVDASGQVLRTVPRGDLRSVQTPQGFRRDVLVAGHEYTSDDATDDASLVERLGIGVHTVVGSDSALKITTPFDLVVAEFLLAAAGPSGPGVDGRRTDLSSLP